MLRNPRRERRTIAGATASPASVERNDDLVRTDEPELVADHFIGEIGIGLARIEKLGAVTKRRFFRLEPRQLRLPSLQVAVVSAPGEQTVRPGNSIAGEIADDDQCKRRPKSTADQTRNSIFSTHPTSKNHDRVSKASET